MELWDQLVLLYSDLHSSRHVIKTPKNCTIYQSMTHLVHVHLGYNSRVPLCNCGVKEVGELFLNEYDAARVGYIDTHGENLDSDISIDLLE